MSFEQELEAAKNIAKEAGEVILEVYAKDFDYSQKGDSTPVTEADIKANDVIVRRLSALFPEDALLTEEAEDTKERLNKNRVWIIDPLDGTKEFIHKNGEFTVNIALVIDKQPVLGVIYVPVTGEMFYGVKGQGSFLEKEGNTSQIFASERKEIHGSVLTKSRSHPNETLNQFMGKIPGLQTATAGSSLKGCLVATAQADLYPRFNPMWEWDICAMHAIVEGAGAKMTDLEGNSIVYNNDHPKIETGFMISNKHLHEEFLSLCRK